MLSLLVAIPLLPLLGFLLLAAGAGRLGRTAVAVIGVGSVALSAAATAALGWSFSQTPPPDHVHIEQLGSWIQSGALQVGFDLRLDPLSLLMMAVITGVGFLIHLYSVEYMADDVSYGRFFACMNLFVAAMLVLVLADNLLLMFLGWEGVGLASYLLIGFWHQDEANSRAATKAFVVTRIGDAGLALALLALFTQLGTLRVGEALERAPQVWGAGSSWPLWVALLLLCGAVGKSGQLPLQVWLPDAMAGPTPVSALIHAATMVTAGVYLVARWHGIFELAPTALAVVRWLAVGTLLLGAGAALAQRDLKRILAYSTISQIGYMFLGLGVGAYSAAMFHFMTHAFFKALLFLAAGWVILALHHKQDIFEMGGLAKELPTAYRSFLVGGTSLAALPFLGSGFFSKEQILAATWDSPHGGPLLWGLAVLGAGITAFYTARMIALVFWGEAHTHVHHQPGRAMQVPLIVLGALALLGGWIELPHLFANVHLFSDFLAPIFPAAHEASTSAGTAWLTFALAEAVVLAGLLFGLQRYKTHREAPAPGLAAAGFGFDALYDRLLVRPYQAIAHLLRRDPAELLPRGAVIFAQEGSALFRGMQSGYLRWSIALLATGAIVLAALATEL